MLKGKQTNRAVVHLETGKLYFSLAEASKAMGRNQCYLQECFENGRPATDVKGNSWTFQELKRGSVKLRRKTTQYVIDEFPGSVFNNCTEASKAIGRWGGYINDCLRKGLEIKNKSGQVMHVHKIERREEC